MSMYDAAGSRKSRAVVLDGDGARMMLRRECQALEQKNSPIDNTTFTCIGQPLLCSFCCTVLYCTVTVTSVFAVSFKYRSDRISLAAMADRCRTALDSLQQAEIRKLKSSVSAESLLEDSFG